MGDTSVKFEVIPGKNQKSEYVMTCGKHTVRGWCEWTRPGAHRTIQPLGRVTRVIVLVSVCVCVDR